MNHSENFVRESLEGILLAYPRQLKMTADNIQAICRYDAPVSGKVSIVTGGGYGHLPVFLGYVGNGLADGVAVGNSFTSPSSQTILDVSHQVHGGKGILYLFGNYFGDAMNFDMASQLLEEENIRTEIVRFCDDIASAPRTQWESRRGVAGLVFAYKTAGAMADEYATLDEVARIARKTAERTATLGVALSSCSLPGQSDIFQIAKDEMEVGMGIHGEPGVKRCKMLSSKEIAELTVNRLIEDLCVQQGDRIAVLINGLGSTTLEELHILYKDAKRTFVDHGVDVTRVYIGEFATSFEMAGASVSVLKLDEELLRLLDKPATSPFVRF